MNDYKRYVNYIVIASISMFVLTGCSGCSDDKTTNSDNDSSNYSYADDYQENTTANSSSIEEITDDQYEGIAYWASKGIVADNSVDNAIVDNEDTTESADMPDGYIENIETVDVSRIEKRNKLIAEEQEQLEKEKELANEWFNEHKYEGIKFVNENGETGADCNIVFSNDDVNIRLKRIDIVEDSIVLTVDIERLIDEPCELLITSISINDCDLNTYYNMHLGEKSIIDSIVINKNLLYEYSIPEIAYIGFESSIIHDNETDTQSNTIFTNHYNESAYDLWGQDQSLSSVDTSYMKLSILKIGNDIINGPYMRVCLENKTDENIEFTTDKIAVNDVLLDGKFVKFIYANKRLITDLYFNSYNKNNVLQDNGIEYFKDYYRITFQASLYDSNDEVLVHMAEISAYVDGK